MSTLSLSNRTQRKILPYLLILPTFTFVTLFTIWPTINAIYLSFFKQRLNVARFREPTFVGLTNYANLFQDPRFIHVLKNTLIYVIGTVPISIFVAFLFAWLVNHPLQGLGWIRLSLFHPTVLPMVSAATIWMFFLTPDYGLFNTALTWLGYSGPQNWTGNPNLALLAVMLVAFWKNAGYYMIFYLAGLQNLPKDVFEAARLDGANTWQQLIHITFPLLRRTTLFVTTIAFIGAFQTIDHIFVLTQGGPSQASTVLLYYLWQIRFEYQDVGKASAITVILIALLLIFTVSNFLISERKEDNNG